ncbi:50S ribosomal protein L5 [Candidatus Vampirococcus lugosii]|uniref:Large ribosomal subunit protein uL5 n=1 Tax=Candidatus Vampirococcus lugosii TaxID=2789015 RepID=A0ABS5QN48_9BACT|nr:50S ribosomal protein L5 [Candidatus Vampirococcus lugosii]MBS8121894.1 50S ribosomal protein L5 [Candidatus Vampirococcus lugosii]
MNLYKDFKEKKIYDLKNKFGLSNIFEVPRVDKIVISMGIGSLATRKGVKDFSDLISNMEVISGQKPTVIKSKKSVSNFKLRDGMPVMLKVTLRREKAYDFLDRLSKLILPRVRDFEGLSSKKFDGNGNYNIGFQNQSVFPELFPEDIKTPHGLQVNIVTTTTDDDKAKELLKTLGIIFN